MDRGDFDKKFSDALKPLSVEVLAEMGAILTEREGRKVDAATTLPAGN